MSSHRRDSRQCGSDGAFPAPQDANRPPWNILHYYSDSDGPWLPAGLVSPDAPNPQSSQSVPVYGAVAYDFRDYRSAGLPSDCGTLPGDSAYGGSRPTFSSVESAPSVHEDDRCVDPLNGERDVEHLASGFNVDPGGPPRRRPAPAPVHYSTNSKYYCSGCRSFVKTKSELKKHAQRHDKPYKCSYAPCPREGKGFSTPNDLKRHKKTVHHEHSGEPVYVCPYEPCLSKKFKLWPRADNFRCHLERTHSIGLRADDNLGLYYYRPAPAKPHDLQGVGSSVAEINLNSRPMHLQDSPGLRGEQIAADSNASNHVPNQELLSQPTPPSDALPPLEERDDEPQFIQPDALGDIQVDQALGPPSLASSSNHFLTNFNVPAWKVAPLQTDDSACHHDDTVMEDVAVDEDRTDGTAGEIFKAGGWAATHTEPSSEPNRPDTSASSSSASEDHQTSSESNEKSLVDSFSTTMAEVRPDDPRLLELLKLLPRNLLEIALKGEGGESDSYDSPPQHDTNLKAPHECPECSKRFFRQCELKKHKKRHEKPYGCTFRRCFKAFGSKNDWKRHESSQHHQLETWNCDLVDCNKVCYRRETFKAHLHKDHQLENDAQLVADKLEGCRLGHHCGPRFWCGFCVQIKEIKETDLKVNLWTKRCDHIDSHLFGKEGLERKSMHEWRYIEDEFEKEDAGHAGTSGPPPSNSSSLSTERIREGSSGKRKGEDAVDLGRHKRCSRSKNYMWLCCNCSQYMSLRTNSRCIDCDHLKCTDNCMVELLQDHELDVWAAAS